MPLSPQHADSDEVAQAIRDDVARDYEMISPIGPAPCRLDGWMDGWMDSSSK